MKRTIPLTALVLLLCFPPAASANGVLIANASTPTCITLVSTDVSVIVEGQVAMTTTTQLFQNTTGAGQTVKYAFPMPEGASATKLRWQWGDTWHTAVFRAGSQDTTLPGGSMAYGLKAYLGGVPLIFGFGQEMQPDSLVTVELTYVQFLPYKYGSVTYSYPGDYRGIQSTPLEHQGLAFQLTSPRTITSIEAVSPAGAPSTNLGSSASVTWNASNTPATQNFVVRYDLSATDLGLFAYSTHIPDSLGYFMFVVEPDPASSVVIRKNFLVVIDRSGSMGGVKMAQAIAAAQYIVNNLNAGDRFNLVDFDNVISAFRPSLVDYSSASRDSALQYIGALTARNMTDIAGAFSTAIPQFTGTPDSVANLLIFLTDGQATAGQTNTDSILAITRRLVQQTGANMSVFTFGIGPDVNKQLLTLLASQNTGLADFLGADEITSKITDFYNSVRNPLLINPTVSFASDSVYETYPAKLPNLYKGFQLFASGLYRPTAPLSVTFSGTAFGRPVTYQYTLTLSDSQETRNEFLPKVWAKMKIEHLLVLYYAAAPGSGVAKELKEEIIALSIAYGVVSPFTSLAEGGGGSTGVEDRGSEVRGPASFELLGNFPNPFNPGTTIMVRKNLGSAQFLVVRIYNILGQLVRTLLVPAQREGMYTVYWDGKDENGAGVSSGIYIYTVEYGTAILGGRMTLLR